MKVTVINGCENHNELEIEVIAKICGDLEEKNVEYYFKNLKEMDLKPCMGCDSCQNVKPGICVVEDGINEILKQYLKSSTSIIITPIQFGSCNSITKNFIDRTEPLFLPYQTLKSGRTVMQTRYDRYPNLIFIGIGKEKDKDMIECFKDTMENCNLAKASIEVKAEIITEKIELENLKKLVFV